MSIKVIKVIWRTGSVDWTELVFKDWYDFADWLKQRNLQHQDVTIKGWEYVQKK